jgi:hypothetical protein
VLACVEARVIDWLMVHTVYAKLSLFDGFNYCGTILVALNVASQHKRAMVQFTSASWSCNNILTIGVKAVKAANDCTPRHHKHKQTNTVTGHDTRHPTALNN